MAKKVEKKIIFINDENQKDEKNAYLLHLLKTKPQAPPVDSVERKLHLLYDLQMIDSSIDDINILRGELPNEVKTLEDEIIGLETRISKILDESKTADSDISRKKMDIENANAQIKKYEEQQKNVRNNREFESLAKEIEFQGLEIELLKKRIRELDTVVKEKKLAEDDARAKLEDRKKDLVVKRQELEKIIDDTRITEESLRGKSVEYQSVIEPRLLNAYRRLRKNARNGLAVVEVKRDACGGCFNKIPPQRQVDIRMGKRLIPCEYCGRILVDWSREQ
jgi:predicted  nucleic acid-binding Zn-ribbon protein